MLEITESVMLADTDFAVQRLHGLKALGVRLAMDDFGTGYSSLSYLSRFPVDILKMDRSFVGAGENVGADRRRSSRSGQASTLDVVAEGIELPEQERSLHDLGCEIGQGFLFARPMPSAGARRRSSQAGPEWTDAGARRRPMQHSHEALDRPGGFARGRLLAPLRHRDFRLLWSGMAVSLRRRRHLPDRHRVGELRRSGTRPRRSRSSASG